MFQHDDTMTKRAMPESLNTESTEVRVSHNAPLVQPQRMGDAGPFGLSAFAFTTFVMSLFNLSAGGVGVPNLIIGPALMYGGLGQLLAGMWYDSVKRSFKETFTDDSTRDMAAGNTVSATIASAYGCFWMSFAVILIPGFGVAEAYSNPAHYSQANGFFMLGFFIFSLAITLVSVKGTYPFLTLTILVNFTWLFLAIANLYTNDVGEPNDVFKKMGGATGLLVSFTAWYNMYAGLANKSNSFIQAPQPRIIREKEVL